MYIENSLLGIVDIILPIIFILSFLIILGIIIFIIFTNIKEWHHNNKQPIVPAKVKIVSKRSAISHYTHGEHHSSQTHQTYYATFEFSNGERLELCVKRNDYSLMAEHDIGILTFQGTRFISFKRHI